MNSKLIASIKDRLQHEFDKSEPDLAVVEADLDAFVAALELDNATEETVELITDELRWLQDSIKMIERQQSETHSELKQLAKSKKNIKHYQNP